MRKHRITQERHLHPIRALRMIEPFLVHLPAQEGTRGCEVWNGVNGKLKAHPNSYRLELLLGAVLSFWLCQNTAS